MARQEVPVPELPDVQVFLELAEAEALDQPIETVSVRAERMLQGTSESTLREALLGHRLTEARRHGKHLFLCSSEPRHRWLRLHFGMTGSLGILEEGDEEPEHTRLRLDYRSGRSLAYVCVRMFGSFGIVDSPEAFAREQGLGPDPWVEQMGLEALRERLSGRRGALKSTLMNQAVLAGLGNVYTDEILFQAGLHPETPVDALSSEQLAQLHRHLHRVLRMAVERRARVEDMPATWLLPHREEGASCPRGDGTIRRLEVGGRAGYLCDQHQVR